MRPVSELRFHWADAYRIDSQDGFVWTAVPLADPAVTIARNSSGELRTALRDHYAEQGTMGRLMDRLRAIVPTGHGFAPVVASALRL